MEVFKGMNEYDHEQVVFYREPSIGYLGIIAIHDTTLGPALGGTRFWNYNSEDEALTDVLRLSLGMTYKAAVAGLNLGGGKSVIIGDPNTPRREMVFRAHGRAVETLKGRYITAEDVGTSVEDMDYVHMETEHVVGIAGRSGDPSPVTAYGTYQGMKACALEKYGDDSLKGKTVAVQGVGHVGYYLCENLAAEGTKLIVTDIAEDKVARCVDDFGAEAVQPDAIYGVDAEIFAPCALGAIVNSETIPQLKCDIIAGAANNQLATYEDGKAVQERDILYAPDYVINAGGLINVYSELADWSTDRSKRKAGEIYQTLLEVFELAREEKLTTGEAADRIAERRIERVGTLHRSRIS
ncbi:MAG: Glu/Leu/Phe/Val dehydrogenase [Gemmatimonadales bacterium]|jgi:leucine dehydrogenase